MSLATVLLALSFTMHPAIEPVPHSTLTMERGGGEKREMVVVYRQGDRRRRWTARGPYWYLEYDLPDEVTRATIIDHFIAESNRIEGISGAPKMEPSYAFLSLDEPCLDDLCEFVRGEAGAELRTKANMNVIVGNHRPPPGGPPSVLGWTRTSVL